MSDELAKQIAYRFIQRRDLRAIQGPDGEYKPDRNWQTKVSNGPFTLQDLRDHLSGAKTFGHYMLDANNKTRLIAFDIDLTESGLVPAKRVDYTDFDEYDRYVGQVYIVNPREVWADRASPYRPWLKFQMRLLGERLASAAHRLLEFPVAVAYSGTKGIHVYCFVGEMDAAHAREGAKIVLASLDSFEPIKRDLSDPSGFSSTDSDDPSLYRDKDQSVFGFPNFTIEVYPKQGSLDGKDLGNLMRLPLGRNLKSSDPTFFLDLNSHMTGLVPHKDPLGLLKKGNPWDE